MPSRAGKEEVLFRSQSLLLHGEQFLEVRLQFVDLLHGQRYHSCVVGQFTPHGAAKWDLIYQGLVG
ncbi:hypothetical protein KSF_085120 [Reticulibacter mediterranei]|uniref:Uncharacterized protein n=1 Tax=Reticulibacter mediterranei TaxID=2778369 RepID=A0A8J3IV75_9CHLR|nr:hypothetical protein [Reticulibacter mediterranei]GHO98464.1 hypothetical protein KSF_085120 [Reticulibacter mediterranei]